MDKKKYKNEVDSFVDRNLGLKAEDILNASNKKDAAVTDLSGVTRKMNNMKKFATIAAASILTVGVVGVAAGAAGIGPLSSLFAQKAAVEPMSHDDIISSYLVEQGYMLDINETQTVDGFDVTFEGATGDWTNVQMLFTIKVKDEEFISTHDKLYMTVYRGFDEETFANRYDTIEWPELGAEDCEYLAEIEERIASGEVEIETIESYIEYDYDAGDAVNYDAVVAYQSAEDPSLYILTYGAYPYYVQQGATIYTQVRSIRSDSYDGIEPPLEDEIMLNCTFSFTLPGEAEGLADDHHFIYEYDDAMSFTDSHEIQYFTTEVIFSEYETQYFCEFFYTGTDLEYIDEDFWSHVDFAGETFQESAGDLRLVVDGTTYEPTELGYVYGDPSGVRRSYVAFPEVDYDAATSVAFEYNGTTITIK